MHTDELDASHVVRGGVPCRLQELIRAVVRTVRVVRLVVAAALVVADTYKERIVVVRIGSGRGHITGRGRGRDRRARCCRRRRSRGWRRRRRRGRRRGSRGRGSGRGGEGGGMRDGEFLLALLRTCERGFERTRLGLEATGGSVLGVLEPEQA